MAQPPDPLQALLQSLQELHGARLHPRELAEILWLARNLPSQQPAGVRASGPMAGEDNRDPGRGRDPEPGAGEEAIPVFDAPLARPSGDPLRFSLPGFFPPAPPRAATPPSAAALLPDQALPTEADLRAVLPLRLQDVRLIPQPRALQAALQPLAALEPLANVANPRRVLDEVATVEACARERRLWPRYRLPREPRLSLVLVVDGGGSMQVWQRLAEEVRATLSQSAAFRDVRVVHLEPEAPAALSGALAGAGEEQVVVVLSDCSGSHWWQGGEPQKLLRWLTRRGPVALLQVLPDWMWRRTALGIGSIVAVRHGQPLAPNRLYQRFALHRGDPPPPRGDDHLVLPLLTLEAGSLSRWSELVRGQGSQLHVAACLPVPWPPITITPGEVTADETEEDRARRRLRAFFQRSSGSAERLLRVLAAAPVLTLPVMRLLLEAMVPEGGPLAMAELLLSGFLHRLDGGAAALTPSRRRRLRLEDRLQFDFAPGVRSVLLDTLPGPQTAEVVQRVSELIEHRWDQCGDVPPFQAFLLDPSRLGEGHPLAAMAPFATMAAEIIERLPGPAYQELAKALRQGAAGDPPDPFPPAAFAFEEFVAPSGVLLNLPHEEVNDAFSTARFVDMPLQEVSFETAMLKQGEVVKEIRANRRFLEPLWQVDSANAREEMPASGAGAVLEMLHIPAGRFLMGSPPDEFRSHKDELPQHEVRLREFFLARTPITQAQWRAVAEWEREEHEDRELWPEELDPDPVARSETPERFRGDQLPVLKVNWEEAMAFCQRLRLRIGKYYTLPSEAQWEYACRAGTTTPFHFGETISSELANYNASFDHPNSLKAKHRILTTDVASFPANAWGLHDMHGNVWEWCIDHWHVNYEGGPEDGRAWVDEKARQLKKRLLRGGSWARNPGDCRSAYRSLNSPDTRSDSVGFRVCCLPQVLLLYP